MEAYSAFQLHMMSTIGDHSRTMSPKFPDLWTSLVRTIVCNCGTPSSPPPTEDVIYERSLIDLTTGLTTNAVIVRKRWCLS